MPGLKRTVISGICGVVSPLLTLALIFLVISFSPWFSWADNALSDLGVSGLAAAVFNFGLVVGGVLSIVFGIGLREVLPRRALSQVGVVLFILSSVSLCGVGFFPETAGMIHFYFSVAFFVLASLSALILGVSMIASSSREVLGWFTLLIGVWAFVPWLFSWRGVAIPELVSALALSAWSIVMGLRMLRGDSGVI